MTHEPTTESELPLSFTAPAERSSVKEPLQGRVRKTIQDVLLQEGLFALKLAHEANSTEKFIDLLQNKLGQNSVETRRRYALYIVKWFFPEGVAGFLPRVWQSYQDETISLDLLRWSYLNQEPIMGKCVVDALFPCENGLMMPATYFDKFLQDYLGENPPEKTRERLKGNLKRIGFLERLPGKPDRLKAVLTQKTSFLLLFHYLFAAKAPRTVEIKHLLGNPFWKYLGYKAEDNVRMLFREADASGLIGKYVVADQLEQVTTCFTLDELLERRVCL